MLASVETLWTLFTKEMLTFLKLYMDVGKDHSEICYCIQLVYTNHENKRADSTDILTLDRNDVSCEC